MLHESEIEKWAERLGFDLVKTEGDEEGYKIIDKRTGVPLRGEFQDLRDVSDELRAREDFAAYS